MFFLNRIEAANDLIIYYLEEKENWNNQQRAKN
jgi:hypothetical protein